MANEEISFVLNSNLDKIASQANILSQNINKLYQSFRKKNVALTEQNRLEDIANEGIKKLSNNYSELTGNISQVTSTNNNFINSINNSNNDLLKIVDSFNKLGEHFKNLNFDLNNLNNNFKILQNFKLPEPDPEALEKAFSIIKKSGDFIHDIIKKILDSIHKIGAQLAIEAINLKPFTLDFMSSFSFNPLKFFGFGTAMKESFELMKMFQQMRHELAYLSDSSGDASKALSLVYEIAGGSAIASGTAQGVLRSLADQGVIANDQLKSIGILSGNLQAATGIAASQWASFTGELAFNYKIPVQGLENITSALIGTNIRGAQLEKVMGTVNKILQTTAFVAGVPTTDSIHGLSKAVGGASKTFQALGISAEKSGSFLEGIVDPENYEKSSFMLAKLGVSAAEYAGYLNDVNGQQKLIQKVMSNLPQLASEIANIESPFARINFAKTLGIDMQIVRQMAGKTKQEIEEIITNYEKENKEKEALEEKKKRMAAESAKFDDMMLGLRLKVLAPVMKMLSSGYLDNFFSVLPNIAKTIGGIFEAMTPIIKEITNVMLVAIPRIGKLVEEWLLPAIKMFPDFLEKMLSFLPFFKLRPKTGNTSEERADYFLGVGGDLLSYLSKIYLMLTGWKALTFLGGFASKAIGFFAPKTKRLMDVTLGEYSDEMRSIMNPKPSLGSKGSMGGLGIAGMGAAGLVASAGLIFGGGKLLKKITGAQELDKNREDLSIDFSEVAERQGQRMTATGIGLYNKFRGGPGPDFGRNLIRQTKVVSGRANTAVQFFADAIPGETPVKPVKTLSTLQKGSRLAKGFGKALGPLGLALTGYQIATAENKEQLGGAIGGAVGGVAGGVIGTVIGGAIAGALVSTGFAAPIGVAIATVSPAIGSMVGGFLGDTIGSSVGRWLDSMDESKKIAAQKSELMKNTFETGISGIFQAFKAGDFNALARMFSLSLENLYLQAKSKFLSFIPLVGSEKKADYEKAKKVMDNALNLLNNPANIKGMSDAALDITIASFKNQLEKMASDSTFTGLSTQTKDEFINAINMQLENTKTLRNSQQAIANNQLQEQKKGNKIAEDHYKFDKSKEDKKESPPVFVDRVRFTPEMGNQIFGQ